MKLSEYIFHSGPVKWVFLYILIISAVSFLLASFKPHSITDVTESIDTTLNITKDMKSTAASLSVVKKNDKKDKRKNVKQNKDSSKIGGSFLKPYLDKYHAVDFSTINYPYTIDYQDSLKNKNAIFYVLISDLFEENKKIYIKAAKSYMGLNIYLKLQCDKTHIKTIKNIQLYTYVVANIQKITSIFLDSKSVDSSNDDDILSTNSSPNVKNLIITGKCIDLFER